MARDDNSQNSNDGDDLTAIKGIGQMRQKWLIKVFDVRTFSDLAALSVDQIETALKAEKQPMVARSELHEWLVQARERAAASDLASQKMVEPAAAEVEEVPDIPTTPEWKPFASFEIEYRQRTREGRTAEYQTGVRHVDDDKSETWPGLEAEEPWRWMLDQVDREALPEPEPPTHNNEREKEHTEALSAETRPAAGPDIAIRVTDVQVRQPIGAGEPIGIGQPGQSFRSAISSAEPFELGVSYDVIGAAASGEIGGKATFMAKFHVRNLHTGESPELGHAIPSVLIEGTSSYRATLASVELPQGIYRVRLLVSLESTPLSSYSETRMLRVL